MISNKKSLTAVVILIAIIMASIIGTAVYLSIEENPDFTEGTLRLINKTEWEALPVNDTLKRQVHPLKNVIIIHTVTRTCHTTVNLF